MFPCLFYLLEAACLPWLMTLPSKCIIPNFGSIVTSPFPSTTLLPPSSKDPYDSIGSTWITQDNLHISRLIHLIPSVKSLLPWKVTESQVLGWGHGHLWRGALLCLPQTYMYVTWGTNTPTYCSWRLVLMLKSSGSLRLLSLFIPKELHFCLAKSSSSAHREKIWSILLPSYCKKESLGRRWSSSLASNSRSGHIEVLSSRNIFIFNSLK